MNTPLYSGMKKNGTTMYVFPSVSEDKNFENQNANFKMQITHFVLVNFPRQAISNALNTIPGQLDPAPNNVLNFINSVATPNGAFYQNTSAVPPVKFKDQLVESLRNYVANHVSVMRNSMIDSTNFYYDTNEPNSPEEYIFWKWCKKLGLIDFEPASPTQEYFGSDPKYNDLGPVGNTNFFREYLWKERSQTIYTVNPVGSISMVVPATIVSYTAPMTYVSSTNLPVPTAGYQQVTITLSATSTLRPGDYITLTSLSDHLGLLLVPAIPTPGSSANYTLSVQLKVVGLSKLNTINDQIIVEINSAALISAFGTIANLSVQLYYSRFVQAIGEISGINNVQQPDQAYTETMAYISYQNGQIPYALFNTIYDDNYKPGSTFPILPSAIQYQIQGGESPNNPLITNPTAYPGDVFGEFDTPGFTYTTQTGNISNRNGNYFGVNAASNVTPSLLYPDFNGQLLDGLQLNLDISDYAEAASYVYPITSFQEFTATAFNQTAPADFEFNAILWYYTINDVTGNTTNSATNLYGIEFLDTPDNDYETTVQTLIPPNAKWVSNGYQDGNAYTFSLDLNYAIDSDVEPATFNPDKVYSLFGMELFYEAMTRLTYFNDQVTDLVATVSTVQQNYNNILGLVYTQPQLEALQSQMTNLNNLLNVYSTLQIGPSATILPVIDTSVTPPLVRLNSIDKQYGFVYTFNASTLFTTFVNTNSFTQYNANQQTIPIVNSKDFLVVINNDDYNIPAVQYDPGVLEPDLSLVIQQDLSFQQKMDIIIQPLSGLTAGTTPLFDKKLDLFINYNDGTNTITQLIQSFNLPVLAAQSGVSTINELTPDFDTTPTYKIRDVYYTVPTSAERNFVIAVEEDFVYSYYNLTGPAYIKRLQAGNRIYINNFQLNSTPTSPTPTVPLFTDFSGQYQLAVDPVYGYGKIYDMELLSVGSSYDANLVGMIVKISAPVNPTYPNDPNVTEDVAIWTDSAGKLTKVQLMTNKSVGTPLNCDYAPFNLSFSPSVSYTQLYSAVGTLTAGAYYYISAYVAGDDFSSSGTAVSGTVNTTGYVFIYNGNPPTWANHSTVKSMYQTVSGTPIVSIGAPALTQASVRFMAQKITLLQVELPNFTVDPVLNTFLTLYDSALSALSSPLNTKFNLKNYCQVGSELTFLKGWKISIVRITSTPGVPVTQLNQRYQITTTLL